MDLSLRRGLCKGKGSHLEEGPKRDRDQFAGDGCWDSQLTGHPQGTGSSATLWSRLGSWGGAQTEPGTSAFPSPSHSSLPTIFIDLGFLAQIGFLFGLNSIPHPACEDIQGLWRTLGQSWGGPWLGKTVARRLGAECNLCLPFLIKACLQLGLSSCQTHHTFTPINTQLKTAQPDHSWLRQSP